MPVSSTVPLRHNGVTRLRQSSAGLSSSSTSSHASNQPQSHPHPHPPSATSSHAAPPDLPSSISTRAPPTADQPLPQDPQAPPDPLATPSHHANPHSDSPPELAQSHPFPLPNPSHDDAKLAREIDQDHRLGLSLWLPLLLVLVPNLGSIMFDAEPQSWSDALIFLLIVFFLYRISKAPWQLYASARTTRILKQARQRGEADSHPKTVIARQRDAYTSELARSELFFLLLAVCSPLLGLGLLRYLAARLDLGLDYLSGDASAVFLLAALVKPLSHLHDRLLTRARFLQSQLRFPAQHAEQLGDALGTLADELAALEQSALTRDQLEGFKRTTVDAPLAALERRLTKHQHADELAQLRSTARLAQLETTLAQLARTLGDAEARLATLAREDAQRRAAPLATLHGSLLALLSAAATERPAERVWTAAGHAKRVSEMPHASFARSRRPGAPAPQMASRVPAGAPQRKPSLGAAFRLAAWPLRLAARVLFAPARAARYMLEHAWASVRPARTCAVERYARLSALNYRTDRTSMGHSRRGGLGGHKEEQEEESESVSGTEGTGPGSPLSDTGDDPGHGPGSWINSPFGGVQDKNDLANRHHNHHHRILNHGHGRGKFGGGEDEDHGDEEDGEYF